MQGMTDTQIDRHTEAHKQERKAHVSGLTITHLGHGTPFVFCRQQQPQPRGVPSVGRHGQGERREEEGKPLLGVPGLLWFWGEGGLVSFTVGGM